MGPASADWKQRLDHELGICVRQVIYHSILTKDGMHILRSLLADATLSERAVWVFFGGKLQTVMRRMMAITPENVEASKVRVLKLLEDVSETLESRDGTIASDEGFGPIELAFSSLAAACVLPENYSNGATQLPDLSVFPTDFQVFAQACRDTRAGQFALECYGQHRSAGPQGSSSGSA
jgi:hypothetical protein